MKHIAILGSTGSIGANALSVVRAHKDKFRIAALSANCDTKALLKQAREFKPRYLCINDSKAASALKKGIGCGIKLFSGQDGIEELVSQKEIDIVLVAISGSAALKPLMAAIGAKKDIALANKESLVMAGSIIMECAKSRGVNILPIDSEQSAIWQCLEGRDRNELGSVYLTASGGPLRGVPQRSFKNITLARVLKHPRWKMGRKITVDSATLMNKGLELLEAMFLFGLPHDKIRIVIHPEAIIHSMVEFIDGVILAQLSETDMRLPIQYALSYPKRLSAKIPRLDFSSLGSLHFEKPDFKKFPALALAIRSASRLGSLPAVMNAANEVAVEGFLKSKIKFIDIAHITERVMDKHRNLIKPGLGEIMEADLWARQQAAGLVRRMSL